MGRYRVFRFFESMTRIEICNGIWYADLYGLGYNVSFVEIRGNAGKHWGLRIDWMRWYGFYRSVFWRQVSVKPFNEFIAEKIPKLDIEIRVTR